MQVQERSVRGRRPFNPTGTEGVGCMWKDLAALAPPLTVAAVFLAGVFWVVRREMGGKRRPERTREKRRSGE